MKIRSGFVSNSSSSSFVMVGIQKSDINEVSIAKALLEKYPETLPDYMKKMPDDEDEREDWAYDVLRNGFITYFSEEGLLGYVIADVSDEDGVLDFSMTIEELIANIEKAKVILGQLGINQNEIKIIGGTRSC